MEARVSATECHFGGSSVSDMTTTDDGIPRDFDFAKQAGDERVKKAWEEVEAQSDKSLLIAFLGTASSGKTSGIKALFDVDMGDISPIPGTTKDVKYAKVTDNVVVADAPGFRDIDEDVSSKAKGILEKVDIFVYVLNAEGGFKQPEKEDYEDCLTHDRPILVVMNKIDLLRSEQREGFLRDQREKLGVSPDDFIPVAFDPLPAIYDEPRKLDAVEAWLMKVLRERGKDLLLAKALREKDRVCDQIIRKATAAAAGIGGTPIPGSDYVPLTALQLGLIAKVAYVYGHEPSKEDALALLTDVVLSQAGRQVFRLAITALKAAGWAGGPVVEGGVMVVGATIAAAVTYGVGKAAKAYYKSGMTISVPDLQDLFRQAYDVQRQAT